MKISVIGAGPIGGNLADRLSKAGHDVLLVDTRGEEITATTSALAGGNRADAEGAISKADVIIMSIAFSKQLELAPILATAPPSTVIVDTANYYPSMNGRVKALDQGEVESVWVQQQLGRAIVKAWNAGLAITQQTMGLPVGASDRIALPVAADSDASRRTVMQLVSESGFEPVDAGTLADSWRMQPGTPAYCTELTSDELTAALLVADHSASAATRDRLIEKFGSLRSAPSHDEVVAINRAAHVEPQG